MYELIIAVSVCYSTLFYTSITITDFSHSDFSYSGVKKGKKYDSIGTCFLVFIFAFDFPSGNGNPCLSKYSSVLQIQMIIKVYSWKYTLEFKIIKI